MIPIDVCTIELKKNCICGRGFFRMHEWLKFLIKGYEKPAIYDVDNVRKLCLMFVDGHLMSDLSYILFIL